MNSLSPSLQYLREEEKITVDPKKIELEYEVLSKFRQLQQDSVPRTYLLDRQRKASTIVRPASPVMWVLSPPSATFLISYNN